MTPAESEHSQTGSGLFLPGEPPAPAFVCQLATGDVTLPNSGLPCGQVRRSDPDMFCNFLSLSHLVSFPYTCRYSGLGVGQPQKSYHTCEILPQQPLPHFRKAPSTEFTARPPTTVWPHGHLPLVLSGCWANWWHGAQPQGSRSLQSF